jgi:hypothetical protein
MSLVRYRTPPSRVTIVPCRRRESNPRRSRSENPVAPGQQSNDGMRTPCECRPRAPGLRTRRSAVNLTGHVVKCAARESDPEPFA